MYFDIKPKNKRPDLFGVEFALSRLINAINDMKTRMIVIKGLKRTGKTSILNVALEESGADYVKIDVRESPYYDRRDFSSFVLAKIEQRLSGVKRLLSGSEFRVSYGDIGASMKLKEREGVSLFEKLDRKLKNKNRMMVIAFDEVQLLQKIEFNQVLASIYDNYEHIKIVITGSEIGVLDEFLGKRDSKSPLFGRPCFEIETKRFENEKSAEFLIKGAKQIGKEMEISDIEEVIGELDGIAGWLTSYGWFRSQGSSHKYALKKSIEEGSLLARDELEGFLGGRRAKANYLFLMKALTKNKNNWEAIKNEFIRTGRKVTDSQLSLYLRELSDYGFICKENGIYRISDPLYARISET